jgi:hypothetical protein
MVGPDGEISHASGPTSTGVPRPPNWDGELYRPPAYLYHSIFPHKAANLFLWPRFWYCDNNTCKIIFFVPKYSLRSTSEGITGIMGGPCSTAPIDVECARMQQR